MKATREVKYYSGNDYLIEVSGELWDMLDAKIKEMMIYHQLLHLDPSFKSKTQEWKMNLRKPDFSDFYAINDKFGNEWYKTIQAQLHHHCMIWIHAKKVKLPFNWLRNGVTFLY